MTDNYAKLVSPRSYDDDDGVEEELKSGRGSFPWMASLGRWEQRFFLSFYIFIHMRTVVN